SPTSPSTSPAPPTPPARYTSSTAAGPPERPDALDRPSRVAQYRPVRCGMRSPAEVRAPGAGFRRNCRWAQEKGGRTRSLGNFRRTSALRQSEELRRCIVTQDRDHLGGSGANLSRAYGNTAVGRATHPFPLDIFVAALANVLDAFEQFSPTLRGQ